MKSKVELLLSREQSSMASSWDEHLGYCQVSEKKWRIGTYGYEWIGSIYELVPEEELYDDDGELVVPEEYQGRKIIGLADGEYLQTEDLVSEDYIDFTPSQIRRARTYCLEQGWDKVEGFDQAWLRFVKVVNPELSLSRNGAFKGRPLLSTGYSNNPSYSGEAQLGIFSMAKKTEVWLWDSEMAADCVLQIRSGFDLKKVVMQMAADDRFAATVDWDALRIRGIPRGQGRLLALAWDAEASSKFAARMFSLWPEDVIERVLGKQGLDMTGISGCGYGALELANDLGVDIEDVDRLAVPAHMDADSISESMEKAVRRVAANIRHREYRQGKKLEPFEPAIEAIVAAYLKDKPKGYYPGMGYIVPPPGGVALRNFLTEYVIQNKALPTGKVSVPYDQGGRGGHRGTFEVDLDALTPEN